MLPSAPQASRAKKKMVRNAHPTFSAHRSLLTAHIPLKIFHNRRGQSRDGERRRLDPGPDAVFRQRRGGDGADGGHHGLGGEFLMNVLRRPSRQNCGPCAELVKVRMSTRPASNTAAASGGTALGGRARYTGTTSSLTPRLDQAVGQHVPGLLGPGQEEARPGPTIWAPGLPGAPRPGRCRAPPPPPG